MNRDLISILKKHQKDFYKVVPYDLNKEHLVIFDFTAANPELDEVDLDDEKSFTSYISNKLAKNNTPVGIGRYNEDRIIYKRSEIFTTNEVRSIHLGIDIWAAAGTPVYAPMDGRIHSFKNNNAKGDYGPTIILEHELENCRFYTLYGHLNVDAIEKLEVGQEIAGGALIANFGTYEENVHWPPHLHFQIIENIGEHWGDYPGVTSATNQEQLLKQCPDPNLILGVTKL